MFGMLYKGGRTGLMIALPHKDLKKQPTPKEIVAEIENGLERVFDKGSYNVYVSLPKFKLDYLNDIVTTFQELGVTDLFDQSVSFCVI
jgi:serine protease inhibitor